MVEFTCNFIYVNVPLWCTYICIGIKMDKLYIEIIEMMLKINKYVYVQVQWQEQQTTTNVYKKMYVF